MRDDRQTKGSSTQKGTRVRLEPQPSRRWWLLGAAACALFIGLAVVTGGVRVMAIANDPQGCGAEGCPLGVTPPAGARTASVPISSASSLTEVNGEAREGVSIANWTAAEVEDGEYLVTASSNVDGGWDGQVFRFSVTVPESGLASLTVRWRGYGEPAEGYPVRLEVYNLLTDQWELERTGQTQAIGMNVELSLTITNSFERYLAADGSLWVRVRADNLELYQPTSFTARAAASQEVRLSWDDINGSEDGYVVERELWGNPSSHELIATLPANSTAYTDFRGSLAPGQVYRYFVSAYRGGLASTIAQVDVTLPTAGKRNNSTISVPGDAASIQEAANLALSGDTISVAAGQYFETVVLRRGNVTLRGAGIGSSVIFGVPNCAEEFCSDVAVFTRSIQAVTVEKFTLTGGLGTLVAGQRYGGGLLVRESAATLRKLDVSRNYLGGATPNGSAIALWQPRLVTVENVAAYLSLAEHGAPIYISGGVDQVTLRHLSVFRNGSGRARTASGPWGLDVVARSAPVEAVSSIFWNNGDGYQVGGEDSAIIELSYSIADADLTHVRDLGNNRSDDPQHVGYDNPHLSASSPAINRAKVTGAPVEDYEGLVRPEGAGYDIGASEYQTPKGGGSTKTSLELSVATPPKPRMRLVPTATRVTSGAERHPRHASLNTDLIETEVVEVTPPGAPQNLMAFGIRPTELSLRWTDNATDEEGFTVYRDGAVVVNVAPSSGIGGNVVFTDYGADLPTRSLAPGQTYCYIVSAYREGTEGYSAEVCATTLESIGDPPAAPTGLLAAGFSATQINLSWTDHADDPNAEDGFNVYRRVGSDAEGNPYVLVNAPVAALPGTGTVTFSDRGLDLPSHELATSTTYCYRVAAYNRFAESTRSDEACGQVLPETLIRAYQFGGEVGDIPLYDDGSHTIDLSAMQFVSEQSCGSPCTLVLETDYRELFVQDQDADLNNVYNSQLFVIHLDTPPEGLSSLNLEWRGHGEAQPNHWVRLALYSFSGDAWVSQLEQNLDSPFTFTTSTPSARLQQFVGEVNGRQSTVLFWVRGRAYIPPPATPANLRVTELNPSNLTLEWDDVATTESEYVVSRAPDDLSGTWVDVATLPADTTRYVDSEVTVATDWRYRVVARQRTLSSDPSNEVAVSTPLYAPKDVNVVALNESSIRVAWGIDVKNPALPLRTSIERYRGVDDPLAPWEVAHETAAGETSWTDSGLEQKTFYTYRVRHKATDGPRVRESVYSTEVYTSTPDASAPAAPTDLAALQVLPNQVNLGWKDNATNETAFVVERQNALTGTWSTVIDNLPPNTQSFGDTGLRPGVTYGYRVKARNATGDSPYSNVIFVTTPGDHGSFTIRSVLPSRNGSSQGMAVLASHGGYVYAASNDVDMGSGKEPWHHLNVWRSVDGGDRNPWEWVGETAQHVSNNLAAAMVSYKGVLVLVSGSNVWSSSDSGTTWTLRLGKGIGSWQSNGFHTHLTVYNDTLYTLLEGGSMYKTSNGTAWTGVDAPSGARALAQWNGKLLTYADEGVRLTRVYIATPDVSSWLPQGNILGDDPNADCDLSNGFIGVGVRLFVGGSGTIPPFTRCLRVSLDAFFWSRVDSLDVGPGVVFPDSTAIVGTNYVTPATVAAFIDGSSGNVSALPVLGLAEGSRMWSLVNFNGTVFATAFKPATSEAGSVLIYGNP